MHIINIILVVLPAVEILTATGGCGYVSASWAAVGEKEECRIVQYIVSLSASRDIPLTENIYNNSYNFTGLYDDRLFNVAVIGTTTVGIVSNPDSTFVRTLSTYILYIYNMHYINVIIMYVLCKQTLVVYTYQM